MIVVTPPSGEEKKFYGNLTVEKDSDTGGAIRLLDDNKPVYDIPQGSQVRVSQAEETPHPRIDPK